MKMARAAALLACAAFVVAACATRPAVIPAGLTAAEIFQRAQDAADSGNYTLGITYYSLVPQNFPDDREHGAWASYEIAFLYHKMGKNDMALTLVKELLDRYAAAGDPLPAGPKVLAEKLKARLDSTPTPAK